MCFVSGVHAQSNTTGNIVGEAAAGDTIVVTNPSTGFSRELTVGADGSYRASSLPPGTYTVTRRSADGDVDTRENIFVSVGAGASVDFTSESATTLDRIRVTSNYIPPIDFSSVESTTIVTEETIDRLPVSRDVTSVALLAPGTTQGDSAFGNLASFGGATVGENAYYINGFNVTNFRTGLGFSNVPFDMYAEYQVKTGGYGAEFGRSTGGVVNATTKRGSNEWHWGASVYWTPEQWRQAYPDVYDANGDLVISNSRDEVDRLETNLYASGPIVRDRLFFYAIGSMRDISEVDYSAAGGRTDGSADNPFWGLKLDAYLTDNHRLEYTGFKDEREFIDAGIREQVNRESYEPVGYEGPIAEAELSGGENHIVKYTGYFGSSFTLSALWGKGTYSVSDYNTGPSGGPECTYVTYNSLESPTRQLGCPMGSLDGLGEDTREAFRVDAEWDLGDVFLGSHFLRFGFDRENNSATNNNTIVGADPYRYILTEQAAADPADGPDQEGHPLEEHWHVRRDIYNNIGEFETISTAFYLEDQWQVTDDVLLSLGIRNEQFENKNANGEAFIKIEDQWAPRLGMSWDIGGQGTMKLFANAGRYHLPVATNTNIRLGGAEAYVREEFLWDGESFTDNFIPIYDESTQYRRTVYGDGTVHPTVSSVDQEIDPMYQDEYILGYEWQFLPKWSVGVRGIYRELGSTLEDMAVDAGLLRYAAQNGFDNFTAGGFDYYVLGNPGYPISIQVDMDGDGTLEPVELSAEILGYPKSERKYKALELFFQRAWDDVWFMQGSYTWANSYGNNEGFVRSDNGQTDAGLTTLFDQPGLLDGAYGDLPNDRTHTIKLWGAWKFLPEFTVSANYVGHSGRPINCFGNHPTDAFAAAYGSESFYCGGELVPRGSRGRTDWVNRLDLGLQYRPMWADEKLALKVDVINVTGEQTATEVDEVGEFSFSTTPNPLYGIGTSFQEPRQVRLSLTYDW